MLNSGLTAPFVARGSYRLYITKANKSRQRSRTSSLTRSSQTRNDSTSECASSRASECSRRGMMVADVAGGRESSKASGAVGVTGVAWRMVVVRYRVVVWTTGGVDAGVWVMKEMMVEVDVAVVVTVCGVRRKDVMAEELEMAGVASTDVVRSWRLESPCDKVGVDVAA